MTVQPSPSQQHRGALEPTRAPERQAHDPAPGPAGRAAGAVARPRVSVVICAYTARRVETLLEAARAVRGQLSDGDELLVIADHNPQLLEQVRERIGTPGERSDAAVRVLANEHRRGLSGARNTGIAAAGGELVAFLDDDAVPRAGWLERLIEPFQDPGVIGAGGVAAPRWERARPDWMPEEFLWVVGCSYRGLPEVPAPIRNPIGANMAFRRSVLQDVGGFTDGIGRVGRTPLGCEETEFAIRAARETGGRIVQQPAATVDHLVTVERQRLRYFLHRCWAEGISKAVVSTLTGGEAALASERRYTTRTLPAGVLHGVRAGLAGEPAGFRRAAAIIAGLTVTVAGYLRGSLSRFQQRAPEPQRPSTEQLEFAPIWTGQLELDGPALPATLEDEQGRPFAQARILIRAAGTPLGFLQLPTASGRTDLEAAVSRARAAFGPGVERARAERDWHAEAADRLVSVVLCTRNRAAGARRTLESLLALRHRDLEIVVVDNDPDDGTTRAVVEELAADHPRLRYVLEPRRGLSRARNRGLDEARGELIAFTDDDVSVDPLWVNGLLRGFAREPNVACVTGLVASASLSRPAEQYFDQRVWWSSSCEPRVFTARRGPGDSPLHPYTAGAFGTGANFAARTAVLRSLGGFDECLGAGSPTRGGEDLDIFVRLIGAGHALCFEPSALVWHEHRVDDDSLRSQMYAYGLGLTAYLTKHLLARGSRAAMLRRLPGGLWHGLMLMRRSRRAGTTATLEQHDMARVELRGMLAGPLVYLRARGAANPEHVRAVAP